MFPGFLAAFLAVLKGFKVSINNYATPLNPRSFTSIVEKQRKNQISAVFFYKDNKNDEKIFREVVDLVAKDTFRAVKVCALNCDEHGDFCKKQEVAKFPTLRIYPLFPFKEYDYDKDLLKEDLKRHLLRQIPSSQVTELTQKNLDTFLTQHVNIPTVVLVTEKKNLPTVFKSVSFEFKNEMQFGVVYGPDDALKRKLGVKKMPEIQIRKTPTSKPVKYDGETDHVKISDWLNLFRETFVRGGGFDHNLEKGGQKAPKAKPWLVQEIPVVSRDSLGPVCLDSKGLWVVYVFNEPNKAYLNPQEEAMLMKLRTKYTSKLQNRGSNFKWLCVNFDKEKEWAKFFNIEKFPGLLIINPHKQRTRFLVLGNDLKADEKGVDYLLEKVNGGDAKFTMFKGNKLPSLVLEDEKDETKKDEL